MTITLTPEWQEWWAEAAKNSPQNPSEPFEFYCQIPRQLGKGHVRNIEVYPQVWLGISNYEYHDDVLYQGWDCVHPLEFGVRLSGTIRDDFGGQIGEGVKSPFQSYDAVFVIDLVASNSLYSASLN